MVYRYGNSYQFSEGSTSGSTGNFDEFVTLINNNTIQPVAVLTQTMIFDDISQQPFVINIASESQSYNYDDGGSQSATKLPNGEYLVNVNSATDISLTKIVADTDHDGIVNLHQLLINYIGSWL